MNPETNLYIHECAVAAGDECQDASEGWKIALVSKGNFYWLAQNTAKEVNTGDVIVIGPSSRGVLRASRIGDSRLHYFYFRPQHLVGLMSLTERLSLETFAADNFLRIIPASNAIAIEFCELVEKNARRRSLFQRCRIINLVGMIFGDTMPASRLNTQQVVTCQLRFEEIIERIPDSDLMACSADKLAEMCGCSARHFRRLFRKHFKTSIRAKQTELRLEKARQLLMETDEKVLSIAAESGYRHLGFFNAMFKRKFGLTPSEWRRRNVLDANDRCTGIRQC